MIAGHIGVAAGAKRWAPSVPLWALLVASFVIDLFAGIMILIGKESISDLPGTDGGYGNLQFEIDWSHSFFGTLLLCLVVLIVCVRWWGGKGAFVLSCVVFSHWFLDSIVHRPDMPIVPGNFGNLPRVGVGMWDFPTFTIILELALVVGGALVWYTSPESSSRSRQVAIATTVVGILVLLADVML